MRLNNNISESISEIITALKLQGFACNSLLKDGEKSLESELLRSVITFANDSGASGTHFFSVLTSHHFHDGSDMQISLNFLYNKEATTLNVHSVVVKWGDIQERFLPNEHKIIPAPSVLWSLLDHKVATENALPQSAHPTGTNALTV